MLLNTLTQVIRRLIRLKRLADQNHVQFSDIELIVPGTDNHGNAPPITVAFDSLDEDTDGDLAWLNNLHSVADGTRAQYRQFYFLQFAAPYTPEVEEQFIATMGMCGITEQRIGPILASMLQLKNVVRATNSQEEFLEGFTGEKPGPC